MVKVNSVNSSTSPPSIRSKLHPSIATGTTGTVAFVTCLAGGATGGAVCTGGFGAAGVVASGG